MTPLEREYVAVHECGHAVAAIAAAWPFESVQLLDEGDIAGSVRPLSPPDVSNLGELRRFVFATYGGHAACHVVFNDPEYVGPWWEDGDFRIALAAAGERYKKRQSIQRFLIDTWNRTTEYYRREEAQYRVFRLASALVEAKVLTFAKVESLLAETPDAPIGL